MNMDDLINAMAGKSGSASITRPNDTAIYAAGDIIGAATGSSAAIEFTNMGAGRSGDLY